MDPNEKGFAMDRPKRMELFDIKVIHFLQSGKAEPIIKCSTPEDFEEAISKGKDQTGTLVITKGISRAVIEALGSKFQLEPEFFASHLAGTELYYTGHYESLVLNPPARTPVFSPDYIRNAPFYTAEYRRPFRIEGGIEEVFRLRRTETTTPRGNHASNTS
jgi:hypothetical protein